MITTTRTRCTGRAGHSRGLIPLTVALLLLAACGRGAPGADELHGVPLAAPLPKRDFTLLTTEGRPFDFRDETAGYVTLLFFGYTHCPDICPLHMANIAAVLHKLTPRVAGRVKVVMVTVDPERDTPERFRAWLDNFDTGFVGLTGDPATITKAQQDLMLPPAIRQGEGASYLMGHAAYVIAFTPDDSAHAIYPSSTRQAAWAHDLPLLVAGNWKRP
jgi:protein SCO1/2